jgi:hypothetical protein
MVDSFINQFTGETRLGPAHQGEQREQRNGTEFVSAPSAPSAFMT